jgi:hypothetical protein
VATVRAARWVAEALIRAGEGKRHAADRIVASAHRFAIGNHQIQLQVDSRALDRPALVVFSNGDKAQRYISTELSEDKSIALVYTHVKDLQRRAFKGDPHGLCIVDPPLLIAVITHKLTGEHLTGLSVEVSKLGEWLAAPQG